MLEKNARPESGKESTSADDVTVDDAVSAKESQRREPPDISPYINREVCLHAEVAFASDAYDDDVDAYRK